MRPVIHCGNGPLLRNAASIFIKAELSAVGGFLADWNHLPNLSQLKKAMIFRESPRTERGIYPSCSFREGSWDQWCDQSFM
jgi:hypothetical protein